MDATQPTTTTAELVEAIDLGLRIGVMGITRDLTLPAEHTVTVLKGCESFDIYRQRFEGLEAENAKLREALAFFVNEPYSVVHMGQRLNRLHITVNDEQLAGFRALLAGFEAP